MALSLLSSGCHDAFTGLTPDPPGSADASRAPDGTARYGFGCTTSLKTPAGVTPYKYGWIKFHVPKSALAADQGLIRYTLRVEDTEKHVYFLAKCIIPNTAEAIAFMNQHLARGKGHLEQPYDNPQHSSLTSAAGRASRDYILPATQILPGMTIVAPYNYWSTGGGGDLGGACTNWCYDASQGDSGGGWYPDPVVSLSCNPETDSTCNQPLTVIDTANIAKAFRDFVKDPTTIADSVARRECTQMADKFAQMFADGHVYRGGSNTRAGEGIAPHFAAYDPYTNTMHFDPMWLDSAATGQSKFIQDLANSALHEMAHALGFDHSEPIAGFYSEEYFNRLSPGTNSCLSWQM